MVGTNGGVDLSELRRHFKKFNLVYLPDGEPVFFRCFDPRVFLASWPHGKLAPAVERFPLVSEIHAASSLAKIQ